MERKNHAHRDFLDGFGTLPREQIIPATQSLIDIKNIDLASKASQSQFQRKIISFGKIFSTILQHQSDEGEKAAAILTDDLNRSLPDKSSLGSTQINGVLFKLALGLEARSSIALRFAANDGLRDTNVGRYYDTVGSHVTKLNDTLASLGINDLTYYIQFQDALDSSTIGHTFTHDENLGESEQALTKRFKEENYQAWERLRTGWGIKQIQEVVSLSPTIFSSSVVTYTAAALLDNLNLLSDNLPQDQRQQVEIDPEGIIAILGWKLREDFPERHKYALPDLEENIGVSDISIPRELLPVIAISVLSHLSKISEKEDFSKLLTEVQTLVTLDRSVFTPWIITLLALRANKSEIADNINNLVREWTDLPEPIRKTFLNERPGRIWLTPEERLRIADAKTSLLSAFPVFTSSKADDETDIKEEPAQIKYAEQPPEVKHITAREIILMPFFGETGRVEDKDISDLLFHMFQRKESLNEDHLLDEYQRLTNLWRREESPDRNILYPSSLNLSDKYIAEAKNYGIEGLYIKDRRIVFILGNDIASAEFSHKILPVRIEGNFDNQGQLSISGMPESFVGEPEHLFLNNLALHAAIQPLLYNSGIPENYDRDIIRAINSTTSNWNRHVSRGTLPKIDRIGNTPYIAIRIPGYKEPVLVGERSR